jgi:GT2 family glycosyltransferase
MAIPIQSVIFLIIQFQPDKKVLSSLCDALKDHQVIIIKNDEGKNLGFAGGANLGMKKAFAMGASWVVVCNQDLILKKDASKKLVEKLSRLPKGIAGPFSGGIDARRMTTIIPSVRADYISGACIAIHKKVYETVGNFYEPYFLYYEEVDYCMRAKRLGFPITHIKMNTITHKESMVLKNNSMAHQYYLARNHLLFVKRLALGRVKCYEFMRMPLTIAEHIACKQWGALAGIRDYVFQKFGPKEGV